MNANLLAEMKPLTQHPQELSGLVATLSESELAMIAGGSPVVNAL
jgi:hypothetical protein